MQTKSRPPTIPQQTRAPDFAAALLDALVESTQDLIWSVDLDFKLITFNKALSNYILKNFGTVTAVGMSPCDLLTPERAERWPPLYKRAVAEGAFRSDILLPDGRLLAMSFNPIVAEGQIVGVSVFGKDITERINAEKTREDAEKNYHALFNDALEGVFQTTLDGKVLTANPALARMLGYESPAGLIAGVKSTADDVWAVPGQRAIYARLLDRCGLLEGYECRFKRKDGAVFWVALNTRKTFAADGTTPIYEGFMVDIDQRKRATEALEQREDLLNETGAMAKVGGWELEVDTGKLNWTREVRRIHEVDEGFTPTLEEAIEFYTRASRPVIEQAVRRAIEEDEPFDLELEIVTARKKKLWVHAIGKIRTRNDGLRVLAGTFQDISRRKMAEAELHDSEERYRATFEQAAVGIVHTAFDGRIIRVNQRFAEIIGYSPEEIPGITYQQITLPEDLPASESMAQQISGGLASPASWEKRYLRKDGSLTWVRLSVSVQLDAEKKPLHYITVVEDINDRKAAEAALHIADLRYREIFEQAPEGIFKTTMAGKIVTLSPAGAKLLGYESSEEAMALIRDTARDVWSSTEMHARSVALLELQNVVHDQQCQFKRKDGSLIWVSVSARRIYGTNGKPCCYQGFFEDISEQKRLEGALSASVRELKLLSDINVALLSARTEAELLREYCRILVEIGGYRMAWVGYAEDGPGKPIVPVAHYGHEDGYLKTLNLTWADTDRGRGLTGRAIRAGTVQFIEDIEADTLMTPWHAEAGRCGFRSAIALPFHYSEGGMACLTAYGGKSNTWSKSEHDLLDQVSLDLGFGITALRTEIAKKRSEEDLRTSLVETIQVIADTIDQRDPYTAGHQRRVADLCKHIAGKMGLANDRALGLQLAASIHDLGKIGIPAELLSKPGPLSPAQFNLVKEHAELGFEIIKSVHFPWPIGDIILQHHERLNGSGYPHALKADAILLESRVLAVADVVEAMSSHRPYRAELGLEAALNEISAKCGTLFDPAVVQACVGLFHEDGYAFPA